MTKHADWRECPSYDGVPEYGGPCWTCRGGADQCPLSYAPEYAEPGRHIHYPYPHEPDPCMNDTCPPWLPKRSPDGRCDVLTCRCNFGIDP